MRKDVKTGMLIGTCLCFVAVVWFIAKQRISTPEAMIRPSQPADEIQAIAEAPAPPELIYPPTALPQIPAPTDAETQPAQPKNTQSPLIHVVKKGQTLSDISKIYYNSTQHWQKIYLANKKKLPKGPNTLKPGMQLVIPD